MAKDKKPEGTKPSKMTVMLFQLEGSDETLQEGFRTITGAINKMVNPSRVFPSASAHVLAAAKNGDDLEAIPDTGIADVDDDTEESVSEQPKTSKISRSSPKQPKILELDLKAGQTPLRQFLEEKNPKTDNRKYLLIAAWMKNNLSVDEVTIDHIYTAYRHMGWTSQKDIGAPLRGMKSQNGWFGKGKEKGAYAINHIGIDVAETTSGE